MSKTLHIGIMPFDVAEKYGVSLTNRLINIDVNPIFLKQGKHKLFLNLNHYFGYTSDTALYAQQLKAVDYAYIKPVCCVVENEELLRGDIKTYCEQLKTAVASLPEQKVTNGGLTFPEIAYWYYSLNPSDYDFYRYNIFQKEPYLNGDFQYKIDAVQYELDVLKTLPVYAINIHYYIGYAQQVQGILRAINFIKNYTGKNVISDECGVYNDVSLLNDCVNIGRESGMKYIILYCGAGGDGKAQPITQQEFESVLAIYIE